MKSKLSVLIIAVLFLGNHSFAQNKAAVQYHFVEASDLGIIGKLMTDTPNPYHRVDTVKYKGFTETENIQVRSTSGLAVAFKTNSPSIHIKAKYGYKSYDTKTMGIALRGYDLYIRRGDSWLWANSACPRLDDEDSEFLLLGGMDKSVKECLVYLPLYSELYGLEFGVEKGCYIKPVENPFRHRIGIFGSSYTQGISAGRPGMTYPAQLARHTGLQILSLGCSGNCKLQPYFADVLCDADVDAFIFDSFSNPTPEEMEDRLFPFIEKIQAAHPGIPLIFQQTIYRERRNFNHDVDNSEQAKMYMADLLMQEACRKYKDVYFIRPNATSPDHETSVDGTHPSDEGYRIWAESIEQPVVDILFRYNIK